MKRVAMPYSRSQLHFIFRMMHSEDMRYLFGPAVDMESVLAGELGLDLSTSAKICRLADLSFNI